MSPDDPAFPRSGHLIDAEAPFNEDRWLAALPQPGMSLRCYLAAKAMQAIRSTEHRGGWAASDVADQAVQDADALIAELNK